jgi:hypothetical protein
MELEATPGAIFLGAFKNRESWEFRAPTGQILERIIISIPEIITKN